MGLETQNFDSNNTLKNGPEVTLPKDNLEKKGIIDYVSTELKKFGNDITNKKSNEKPTKFQEFLAKIMGFFNGVDIEKGVIVKGSKDLEKIYEIFLPIIDLKETSIDLKQGDLIVYNKDLGTVDIYPSDGSQKSGYSQNPSGKVLVGNRQITEPKPEDFSFDLDGNNKGGFLASSLGKFIKSLGPIKSGPDSCGRAVHMILKKFGIENTPRGHGNQWYGLLKNDPRFKLVDVNSLSEIPAGGILTFSGKGKINGKSHGSKMNQKYGHVEVKGEDNLFYSFYASKNPGGSAKAPQFHNNFTKWKEATGFTGVFVPISKTKDGLKNINNSTNLSVENNGFKNSNDSIENKNFINDQLNILKTRGLKPSQNAIIVSSKKQKTYLVDYNGNILKQYGVSTSKYGIGNESGSEKTSTGTLRIGQKVGAGAEKLTRFKGLKPAGKVKMSYQDTDNDYITSRVLTLEGMDKENKNVRSRAIYFHGTNEEFLIGKKSSHGCIRMKNDDIIEMFDMVNAGTLVRIV